MNPIAVTMGEPAGIGPDITLKAWLRRAELDLPPFLVCGPPALYRERARQLGLEVKVRGVTGPEEAAGAFEGALPVLPLDAPSVVAGRTDPAAAASVVASIETAVAWVRDRRLSAVVTNPIAKSVLTRAGFAHPGHTEFLAALASRDGAPPARAVMMLAAEELRVVPVTVHIALADVAGALSGDLIVETARIVHRDLKARFGIAEPRLALTGLNPHAGESGTMGREEMETIKPAIERLFALGIAASGPFAADSLFHAEARARYDVALAMYHDQALIPIKTLAFDRAVNVTLGLPFVRTSPDHGTALDIAGTGQARETSLVEAIRLAARLAAAENAGPDGP